MYFEVSIDKRVQHVKMPENLVIGMLVREQEKELFFVKHTSRMIKGAEELENFLNC